MDGLDAIYNSYPKATFINVVRNASDWYNSLLNWSHGGLFVKLRLCNGTGFPNGQSTRTDIQEFYEWHNNRIRQFVKDRPSINYIEIHVDDPIAGQILENRTGIPSSCWKHCRPDSPYCEG